MIYCISEQLNLSSTECKPSGFDISSIGVTYHVDMLDALDTPMTDPLSINASNVTFGEDYFDEGTKLYGNTGGFTMGSVTMGNHLLNTENEINTVKLPQFFDDIGELGECF